ncbi:MAG: histidine kinase [Bacteroidota bacterium]|nr:histidine kinase [Bacteroidota bacterium]
MERYAFIFSNKLSYRLRRHASFWTVWWIFQSFLYSFSAGIFNLTYFERLPVSTVEALIYLVPHMFLSYSLMYYAIPRFLLKGKYVQTALVVIGLFVITGTLSALIGMYILDHVRCLILGNVYAPQHINQVNFFLSLLSGLRGGLTIGGIAAAIKLMKYWHSKEQRNLQLQKEAISSQLQLLKAQVHPHFLFNTLNNIYSGTQATAPAAAKMIMGLSQLLRYMLYECNQTLVPLNRELTMLKQYILLEQNRYGNSLDVNMDLPSAETGLAIAPLLLLPFVENSFKHGTSHVLEQPWISLRITVEEDWLRMKLVNGKIETDPSPASGIGLANVQKRLDLLYPGQHELVVNNEPEVFIVNLRLLLEKTVTPVAITNRITTEHYA